MGSIRRAVFLTMIFGNLLFLPLSCKTTNRAGNVPAPEGRPPAAASGDEAQPERSSGITDEIRRLTEEGTLASMQGAIELIRSRNLGSTDFGRVMNAANTILIRQVYGLTDIDLPVPDLPQTHLYARILRGAERGTYTAPPPNSSDYLECVLPFLSLINETRQEALLAALPDLQRAQGIRPDSPLAPYFAALAHERIGQLAEAREEFAKALSVSEECYPAALGLARLMRLSGNEKEALDMLAELSERYPGNMPIMRQFATACYQSGDWARAEPIIAEVLKKHPRDGEFLLMRSHILVETGQYMRSQGSLDTYASFNPFTRLYLFLRARIQAEALQNREQALNFLQTLLRSYPDDEEATLYTARLLLESALAGEQAEGRQLLRRMLENDSPPLSVLALALQDAISRESWQEAQGFQRRLLAERRSGKDLYDAYLVERGLGNSSRALSYARELYERDMRNDNGIATYISALIDLNRKEEAARLIEQRLSALSGGQEKSRYLYLRSRIGANEEVVMTDLGSALFENPRNLNALIAMFEIYHNRKDSRRAVYYLKQALAIAPGNPRLMRFEREYAGLF
ncbi:MAG: tetratricopeptide repeat protein [Treponema sp.]|nr:tetratricopeptide repeat protein [Treponema sp.]